VRERYTKAHQTRNALTKEKEDEIFNRLYIQSLQNGFMDLDLALEDEDLQYLEDEILEPQRPQTGKVGDVQSQMERIVQIGSKWKERKSRRAVTLSVFAN
jgi:hypothetical protein